jgi:hypothetical protein
MASIAVDRGRVGSVIEAKSSGRGTRSTTSPSLITTHAIQANSRAKATITTLLKSHDQKCMRVARRVTRALPCRALREHRQAGNACASRGMRRGTWATTPSTRAWADFRKSPSGWSCRTTVDDSGSYACHTKPARRAATVPCHGKVMS